MNDFVSVSEIYGIPIGLKIPQREKEQYIMQLKGKLYLVKFGHHVYLVASAFMKVL